MTFDAEDRALHDRLRQKYAGMVVDRSQEERLGEGVVRQYDLDYFNSHTCTLYACTLGREVYPVSFLRTCNISSLTG